MSHEYVGFATNEKKSSEMCKTAKNGLGEYAGVHCILAQMCAPVWNTHLPSCASSEIVN
jgi:hypothetical protein